MYICIYIYIIRYYVCVYLFKGLRLCRRPQKIDVWMIGCGREELAETHLNPVDGHGKHVLFQCQAPIVRAGSKNHPEF